LNKLKGKAQYTPLVFTLLVAFLAFGFVYLRGQDRNWDLLNYHFYAGYALLNGRYLQDIAAASLQTFFNPLVNVYSYLSLKYLSFPFSAWSILLIQLLSVPAIVLIAREIGKGMGYEKITLTEILALVLCVLAPLWWSELGTTLFSSTTAPLILWGIYLLLLEYSIQPPVKHGLAVAGFFFGFAAGLKLTNAPFAVGATILLLYLLCDRSLRYLTGRVSLFIVSGIIGYAITAWWNWHLWHTWASPLFPLYNAIFESPYYDLVNWRDMHWHFSSVSDLLTFIIQAASGTGKTSEVAFTDIRLLIVVSLLPGVILCKPAISFGRQVTAFLLFVFSSFALWAVMLAYQRYLIPVELLLGLVIWIFVFRICERKLMRVTILVCLVVLSAYFIHIPDWGHAKVDIGTKNPFAMEIPDPLTKTPAKYIVVSAPMAYVLPYLHADSKFYGIRASKQIDEVIAGQLIQPSHLPIRILVRDDDVQVIWDRLKTYGYNRTSHKLDCNYFKTGIGRYVVCEVKPISQKQPVDDFIIDAELSEPKHLITKGILYEKGLSQPEPWGRWSDGERVELGFVNCLPAGKIKMTVTGHAFGPNADKRFRFVLGKKEDAAIFNKSDSVVSMSFVNREECANKLTIHIPTPKSPVELGLSKDSRKLGLGIVRVRILKE